MRVLVISDGPKFFIIKKVAISLPEPQISIF